MPLLLSEPKRACDLVPGDFICMSTRPSSAETDWAQVHRIVEVEGLPSITVELDGGRVRRFAPSARVDWCKEVAD